VPIIIRRNCFEGCGGFFYGVEAEQSFGIRQKAAGPSILDDNGFSTREIAQTPVTDPRILQVNAGRFDGAEFSNR
jgi:hypothetical protein